MKPLPRYFKVNGDLVKVFRHNDKIQGQVIATGAPYPVSRAMSKGMELTEKEFAAEKLRILRNPHVIQPKRFQ